MTLQSGSFDNSSRMDRCGTIATIGMRSPGTGMGLIGSQWLWSCHVNL